MDYNPWQVDTIEDFSYYKCPECSFEVRKQQVFQEHAIENHPLSYVFFGKKDEEEEFHDPLKIEDVTSNAMVVQYEKLPNKKGIGFKNNLQETQRTENIDAKVETHDHIEECIIEILNNLLESIEHSQYAKEVELECNVAKENIIQTEDMNKTEENTEEVLNRSCDLVEDLSFTSVDSTSSEAAWTSATNSSGHSFAGENDVQDEILEGKSDEAKGFFKFLEEKEAKSGKRCRTYRTKQKVVSKVKRVSKKWDNSNVKKVEKR